VLAEDRARQTRSEVDRRCGGALTTKKTAPVVRRSRPQLDVPNGAEVGPGQRSSVTAQWSWWPRLEAAPSK
jgi:hypothetical protein